MPGSSAKAILRSGLTGLQPREGAGGSGFRVYKGLGFRVMAQGLGLGV